MPNPFMSSGQFTSYKGPEEDIYAASNAQRSQATAFGPPDPVISSPVDMSQGVESKAKAGASKPDPIWGTSASDRVAALGRNPLVKAASPPPAMPDIYAAPVAAKPSSQGRPMAQGNALSRGARAGAASSLGGPVPVGSGKPMGLRLLERAARRRDPRAIAQLANIEVNQANSPQARNDQWEEMMFGQPQAGASAKAAQPAGSPDIFAPDFWAGEQQKSADFWTEQQNKEAAEAKGPVEIFPMEGSGGFVPMVRNADGSTKAAGGFFPGAAPDPLALPKTPPGYDKNKEEEDYFKGQGLKVSEGEDSRGRKWKLPDAPKSTDSVTEETDAEGKILKRTTRSTAPAGTKTKFYTSGLF